MTSDEFVALVRTMRRDQREYEEHLTSAANMVRKHSERLVDEALAGMAVDEFRAVPEADEAVEVICHAGQ